MRGIAGLDHRTQHRNRAGPRRLVLPRGRQLGSDNEQNRRSGDNKTAVGSGHLDQARVHGHGGTSVASHVPGRKAHASGRHARFGLQAGQRSLASQGRLLRSQD